MHPEAGVDVFSPVGRMRAADGSATQMNPIIETRGLSKHFGGIRALVDVDLAVPEGTVFALLGPNGSGKTTTIKLLLNLDRPSGGSATVLGTSVKRLGVRELRQIGYVSENQDVPAWMTTRQLLDYCRPLYPQWDDALCDRLRVQLDVTTDRPLGRLSRGARAKAVLLSSLAYRPRVLVLDEPFGGLDPVVREEVLVTVRRTATEHGGTVFISSHDMEEVERLADWVAFLDEGALRTVEPFPTLMGRFRRVEVRLPPGALAPSVLPPAWVSPSVSGSRLTFVDTAFDEASAAAFLRQMFGADAEWSAQGLPLSSIFRLLTGAGHRGAPAP